MTRYDRIAFCFAAGLLLLGAAFGFVLGHYGVTKKSDQVVEIRRDTVVRYDTVRLDHFREVTKKVTDTMWVAVSKKENTTPASDGVMHKKERNSVHSDDTMYAKGQNLVHSEDLGKLPANKNSLTDSTLRNERISSANKDSLLVGLPYEQVTVKDSLFTAQISGYKPHLDWIQLTMPTKYVTVETREKSQPKHWSFGITAGVGAVYNQNGIQCGPGVIAGVQYRF